MSFLTCYSIHDTCEINTMDSWIFFEICVIFFHAIFRRLSEHGVKGKRRSQEDERKNPVSNANCGSNFAMHSAIFETIVFPTTGSEMEPMYENLHFMGVRHSVL